MIAIRTAAESASGTSIQRRDRCNKHCKILLLLPRLGHIECPSTTFRHGILCALHFHPRNPVIGNDLTNRLQPFSTSQTAYLYLIPLLCWLRVGKNTQRQNVYLKTQNGIFVADSSFPRERRLDRGKSSNYVWFWLGRAMRAKYLMVNPNKCPISCRSSIVYSHKLADDVFSLSRGCAQRRTRIE